MAITYALYPNPVITGKETFRALIKNRRKYKLEDIERNMIQRHPGISPGAIQAVLALFMEEVENVLAEGGVVSTPLFHAQCSIKGNFDGPADIFSNQRHTINVKIRPGSQLKEVPKKVHTHKVSPGHPSPEPDQFTDASSGIVNGKATTGGPAIIGGRYLQFDADSPDEGIFFKGEGNHSYQVETVYRNSFSQLLFLIPQGLATGEYSIEVRSRMKTRSLRTGVLGSVIIAGETTS